jgi:NADH-quinone oxidoreductase subunit L
MGISVEILREVGTAGAEAIHLPLFSPTWSGVQFGFYIDRLAAVMMTLITGIGLLIYLFSIQYMQQESGRVRYHVLLNLTTFVLLCMVASGNLLMLFVFWQLLSWLLYLLSYHHSHTPTVRGAAKTYTLLRLGDVAFLSGIVLAYRFYGTLDFPRLFISAARNHETLMLWPGGMVSIHTATVITLLIFVGAMSKSAQFPIHIWLPGSLYAPTPVHALLHAGIINAGGFLLTRLAPLYSLSPATLHVVFVVGLVTALLGAGMMLTQNDIKKTLGHSTIGQMGYMIMECGLGAFSLAIFHLIAHGLFKATVFLNCGHVIHAARQEPKRPLALEPEEKRDEGGFSHLTWGAGFVMTLILPLTILLAAHGALKIPLIESQGAVVFLFFGWVTSSQAILTLHRLRAVSSWKTAALMLLTLLLVVLTYLFAAERFTLFLFPAPGQAAFYFQAAALPVRLFDALVAATALSIVLGWFFIYAKTHPLPIRTPEWITLLQIRLYVLFINRLYLENLYSRVGRKVLRSLDRSARRILFLSLFGLAAFATLLLLLPIAGRIRDLPIESAAFFLVAALGLPLFPLHGIYVAALTRLPGCLAALFAVLLPASGLYAIGNLLPNLPAEVLAVVGFLGLLGSVYGSIKALVQFRAERLIAYGGVALISILWWYLAGVGAATPQGWVYVVGVGFSTGGLFLAWSAVRARYGDLDLDRIGGLAGTMPRFALLLSLLVMASMGLPPFGVFSGFMEMLLNRSLPMSWDLAVVLLAWLLGSWFFLNLLQRLLFGPRRGDILSTDLRRGEVASLVFILLILLAVGIAPYGFIGFGTQPSVLTNQRANASVEGEAPAAWPMEGATPAPVINTLWIK